MKNNNRKIKKKVLTYVSLGDKIDFAVANKGYLNRTGNKGIIL